jgi:hypothetical protein
MGIIVPGPWTLRGDPNKKRSQHRAARAVKESFWQRRMALFYRLLKELPVNEQCDALNAATKLAMLRHADADLLAARLNHYRQVKDLEREGCGE